MDDDEQRAADRAAFEQERLDALRPPANPHYGERFTGIGSSEIHVDVDPAALHKEASRLASKEKARRDSIGEPKGWRSRTDETEPGRSVGFGYKSGCSSQEGHHWITSMLGGEPISIPQCSQCSDFHWKEIRDQAERFARKYAAKLMEEKYGFFEYPDGSRRMIPNPDGEPRMINIQQVYNLFASDTVNECAPVEAADGLTDPAILGRGEDWSITRFDGQVLEQHLHRWVIAPDATVQLATCTYVYGDGVRCDTGVSTKLPVPFPLGAQRIYPFV